MHRQSSCAWGHCARRLAGEYRCHSKIGKTLVCSVSQRSARGRAYWAACAQRRARPGLGAVERCTVTTSGRIRRVSPDAIRAWYAELGGRWEEGGYYWGAFEGRRLIGYAGLIPSRRFSDAVYLHCAGVLPEARGNHLQRRLIRVRLAWARRSGYLWAVTYVMPYNVPSLRSLIACGFRPYAPTIAWSGRDVVYLTRSTERQT